MANQEQLDILKEGVEVWNAWRAENEGVRVDLSGADLKQAILTGADLYYANLSGAILNEADLPEKGLPTSFKAIPKRAVGKEEARRFITWLLDASEYVLTFTVAAVVADYAVKFSRTVYDAIRAKLEKDRAADFIPIKCTHPTTQVEIILLLDADFLRSGIRDFGVSDLDALISWLFKRYDEIVDSSQVKTIFFVMTREEPYWELDSFIDQAGRLVEV